MVGMPLLTYPPGWDTVAAGKVKDWTVIANKIPGRTNKDCRKRWHNVLSGGFNKGYWTEEEDELLTLAVQTHGEIWTAVAEVVKTRSPDQCAKRWKQCLDPQLDHSEWTEEDNRRLVQAAAVKGRRWKEIQIEHFPSRSRNSIKNQFTILTRRENKLSPSRRRKPKEGTQPGSHTDSSSESGDDDDGESSNEEDYNHNGRSTVEDSSHQGQSSYCSPSNLTHPLATPDEISPCAGLDASAWDKVTPAGVSGHTWDTTLSSDTEFSRHEFHGDLPDLATVSPEVLQGFYPDLLSPTPTDMPWVFDQGDLAMSGVESHQHLPGPPTNPRGSKVVLTVEGPDHQTVEALVQVAFLSGTPFHLARG
ncbi:predicted protein [Aspergillus terreus NIH2624]|uniref:Uncharacterized protein n=1 Tax=Aspergillus terreus (strain NIH 2624 / FGSC A1156) TaxID=341663 RepID=Q0CG16_ASPTN|nr:uncharacterized protein ATEG_07376 [Aspergillus terreus NIH2624]EAU32760.1 predicted protein [Aspergillus terreus NIH2624]